MRKNIRVLKEEIQAAGITASQVLGLIGIPAVEGKKIAIRKEAKPSCHVYEKHLTDFGNGVRVYNLYSIMEEIGNYEFPESVKAIYRAFIGDPDELVGNSNIIRMYASAPKSSSSVPVARNLIKFSSSISSNADSLEKARLLFVPIEELNRAPYLEYFKSRCLPDAFKIFKRCGIGVGFNKSNPSNVILKWSPTCYTTFSITNRSYKGQYGAGVSYIDLGYATGIAYAFEGWADAISYLQYNVNCSRRSDLPCRPYNFLVLHGLKTRSALELLKEKKIQVLFLHLDNDEAGEKVAAEFAVQLKEQVIDCVNLVHLFKKHQVKDFNEYLVKLTAQPF